MRSGDPFQYNDTAFVSVRSMPTAGIREKLI
jgi:hypothetical protein